MRILKWMLLAAAIFLLQTQFSFFNGSLNLTVTLVYLFGLTTLQNISARDYSGSKADLECVAFGAAVGLAEDILSGSIIGPGILGKGLVGFLTPVIFTSVIFRWTPLWGGIIIVIFTVLDGIIMCSSRALFTGISLSSSTLVQVLVIQSAMNIPFGVILKPEYKG